MWNVPSSHLLGELSKLPIALTHKSAQHFGNSVARVKCVKLDKCLCVCARAFLFCFYQLLKAVKCSLKQAVEIRSTWLHRRYNETFQYKNWVSKSIFAPSNKIIVIHFLYSLHYLAVFIWRFHFYLASVISSHFKSACYKSMKTVLYCKPQCIVDSSNLRMTEARQGWQ